MCALAPYLRCGEILGGSRPVRGARHARRQCRAGYLASCECVVKFPGNGCPHLLSPPARDLVKFGVVQGPSSDHSGLSLTPKLNFSVIVTPACASDMETGVIVACGTPEHGFPLLEGHFSVCSGWVFLEILVVPGATNHAEFVVVEAGERSGGVVPHPGVCGLSKGSPDQGY